jgi:adenine-specific DNA-methyltransferase
MTIVNDEPEKIDLKSLDVTEKKRRELLRLFPEVRTEGGKIDFDRLKLALGEMVDVGRERYGMNWPGKAECFRTIQAPSMATLRPCKEESVNWDTTENLIIEGDNLEVLKLLQKAYLGKVKMIYIDPPYNTGNDFIYPDNYSESLQTYLEYTGQVDAQGKKFGTNPETDGRFHSKWLSMMYPRLLLARNVLCDDGVLFVSADDHEVNNLRSILDEVMGEENFLSTVIWEKVFGPKNTARHFSEDHDYIVAYSRNADNWRPLLLPRSEEATARYENPDDDPRGPWSSSDLTARNYYSEGTYEVTGPSGRIFRPSMGTYWRVKKSKFEALDKDHRVWWGPSGESMPRLKRFISEVKDGVVPRTLWRHQDVGHTQESKKELLEFVQFENTDNVLDSVKPTRLLQRMLQIGTRPDAEDIILDFFGGSGTTAHSVIQQNQKDGGNRRFILVQLPEPLPVGESKLKTISDIAKARVGNAIERSTRNVSVPPAEVMGFRVFTLSESNFLPWQPNGITENREIGQQLDLHIAHLRKNRTRDDVLFEILLREGYPPTTRIVSESSGSKVFCSVADGMMLVCLERELTLDLIRAMANLAPQRVVCLDEGFAGNDQLKANAVQIFKSKNIVFRTV